MKSSFFVIFLIVEGNLPGMIASFQMEREAHRESWKSRFGFMMAAIGSAVGLVNIWRFPYIVQAHGGAAFIAVYVLFLFLIGYPVLVSEVLIGRTAARGPFGALKGIAKKSWGPAGKGILITGFLVSSFYSVVAGWVVGYLVHAVAGGFSGLLSIQSAKQLFESSIGSPFWCLGYHLVFMVCALALLHRGVRRGIELGNKVMMPLLVVLLLIVMIRGLTLPGGGTGLSFLLQPNWSLLTPIGILTALGHAFFTLSLGQGTMITYGSYLSGREEITRTCMPIVFYDTLVSLIAGIAVLTIVYGAGESAAGGEGLLFATLPTVFAEIPGGALMGILFFASVFLAALTSQTSALEPAINYFIDEKGWSRSKAVAVVGILAFLVGVPSALSFNVLKEATLGGYTFFQIISNFTMDILIPLGGLIAVLYVGWIWGFEKAYPYLVSEKERGPVRTYLYVCIKFVTPALIALIFLSTLGIF